MSAAVVLLLAFFRGVMQSHDPFAAAPRLAHRLAAHESRDADWRRFALDDAFIELGPFAARTPRKMVIVSHHPTLPAALTYVRELGTALPALAHPPLPPDVDGPLAYRGAVVVGRKPVGLEIDVVEDGDGWRVAVTLIAGGPRTLVPL